MWSTVRSLGLKQISRPAGRRWTTSATNAASSTKAAWKLPTSITIGTTSLVACLLYLHNYRVLQTEAGARVKKPAGSSQVQADGAPKEDSGGTKTFRLDDVRSHGPDHKNVWVTRGTSVYDITEWIPAHPGGNVILNAAGGSIDAFWEIFTIHLKPEVTDILESYKIGEIDARDLVDGKVPSVAITDPFQAEPDRDRRLIVHSRKPRNAETPAEGLKSFITTPELFYVRNHLWVPHLSDSERTNYNLVLETLDGEEKKFSLEALDQLEQRTITATLQCSGNRRSHMNSSSPPVSGLPWASGAISTATFTGPLLSDVLKQVGVSSETKNISELHLQAVGLEGYGASIPLYKALDPRGDVILATMMNGYPIPRDHGSPLRLIVPGVVAARSVKFVSKLVVSDEESHSQWQRRDYKSFGPNETQQSADWDSAPAIQETPVNSAITNIEERYVVKGEGIDGHDYVVVSGYAFAGGGRDIARVDISVDGGKSWKQAKMLPDNAQGSQRWAWKRWRHEVGRAEIEAGGELVVKAVDIGYNVQPEQHGGIHNFRGNLANAWHRVKYPVTAGGD
ncbi:Putative uncharacterized protein [Taphrina deformans PYCC 5710]|uniref:Nitrate reductase [NADPH] n=1 Tax=Taphrina deformans (strain PYCC 5710 / ATCC 11124 / CBS 356.35 / IMI 108563 / JCM 9778 / NBRC 8474) TaxID=1097556 RepID=R4XCZ5_TAPDE|nr:Putative uncharacterized protein [Taphrina deformans PYCC 5710]|eukprot:CCG83483.1 Putative uncharacterized protein [Taphrina deformans PYCC 5710]